MLDRRFIRENAEIVKGAVRAKGIDLDIDELLYLDQLMRKLQFEVDEAQARRKVFAKQFAKADEASRAEMRAEHDGFDRELRELRERLTETSAKLHELLLLTPGIPWDGAPVGADESANVTIRTWGERPEFSFEPLDHVEIAEKRGWAEFARARKVAGERAYALVGDLVLLERAIHSYALDLLRARNFTPISVPALVKEAPLVGSGMFPKGREETYELPADDLFLVRQPHFGL